MHGVLGPHRTASISGELTGADAPPPPADATGPTVRGLGASDSERSRSHPDDVSRKGSGGATVLGSRARCAACARFLRTGLDRREGARMVGCARSRPRCGTGGWSEGSDGVTWPKAVRSIHRNFGQLPNPPDRWSIGHRLTRWITATESRPGAAAGRSSGVRAAPDTACRPSGRPTAGD